VSPAESWDLTTALVTDIIFPRLLLVDLDHPPQFLSSTFDCPVEKSSTCCDWVLAISAVAVWLCMLAQ